MLRLSIATLTLFLLTAPIAAEPTTPEMLDNPEFKHWVNFKIGTSITHRMTSTAGDTTSKMETTTTLKSKGKDSLVLTMSTESYIKFPGQEERKMTSPAQDRVVPSKYAKVAPPKDAPKMPEPEIKEGTETIEVLGKKFECTWHWSKLTMGPMTTISKSWMSKKVPGQLVKMSGTSTGMGADSTTEMVLIKFSTP